jgi:hypothetical protein
MTTEHRQLPIKLQEFQRIVIYLKNKLNKSNIDDNVFELAKKIREEIIYVNRQNELTVYDITDRCFEYINNTYMNHCEEP